MDRAEDFTELLRHKRADILRVAAKHGAFNVRIFGSAVRGEMTAQSDVDILVELEPGRSLLDHAALTLDAHHKPPPLAQYACRADSSGKVRHRRFQL
jgi:predicted nucleotidyltransferase